MKVALIAPSSVPYTVGGAEKLWWGLLSELNRRAGFEVELIKVPSPERNFWELMESYKRFSEMDLSHFDLLISTKYPAWMVSHHNHHLYLQHKLRGLYDTYPLATDSEFSAKNQRQLYAQFGDLFRFMEDMSVSHKDLPLFWELLFRAKDRGGEAEFIFPGPATRQIVHFLDRLALAPGQIKSYAAISRNVAQRENYFPPKIFPEIIYHPSDLNGLHSECYDNFFTVSRLDGPKRIDLIIDAFMKTTGDVGLRIAGVGPEEKRLKAMSIEDKRIQFLGRIEDARVIDEYSKALCVPFVPYDEDYGLVTIEAMSASKPVITVNDAGGVTEFVENGVTGFSVVPDADHLAAAMQLMINDVTAAQAMGVTACKKVSNINWKITLDRLLDNIDSVEKKIISPQQLSSPAKVEYTAPAVKKKCVVVVHFPVWPPSAGGQARIFHLYKEVAKKMQVTLFCQSVAEGKYRLLQLAPDFIEVTVPKSDEQWQQDVRLRKMLSASVADLAAIEYHWLSPDFSRRLEQRVADADIVIVSHPYLYDAVREVYKGELWYDAHNLELDMKAVVLGHCEDLAEPFLQKVKDIERRCCEDARKILVCSKDDKKKFISTYGLETSKFVLVPNGVSISKKQFTPPSQRPEHKKAIGLAERPVILFIGSWHGPNVEALGKIRDMAEKMHHCDFFIMGTVCRHPLAQQLPGNIYLLGVVLEQEKAVWMSCADVALNPMLTGSGTNLKMADYAAAGIPIVTTAIGNRGLSYTSDQVVETGIENFSVMIDFLLVESTENLDTMALNAFNYTKNHFDWKKIAEPVLELVS